MTIEEKVDNEADLVQTTAVNGSTVVLPVLYVSQVKELIEEACTKQREICARKVRDFEPDEMTTLTLKENILNAPEPTWED